MPPVFDKNLYLTVSCNCGMFKKALTALLVLVSFCIDTGAQEEFVPQQAKFITKLPFTQLTGGVIIVRAQLDGQLSDTLNFVLDTGSGGISLDSSVVEKYHLQVTQTNNVIRGIAGMKQVSFSYGHSLHLADLKVDSLAFHINDYELLGSVYGIRVDGIIGYSFLRRYIVKIDYDDQMIEIYTPGAIRYPKGGILMHPGFTTLPTPYLTVQDAKQVTGRFIFDSGAGLCFLLSKEFVEDSSLFEKHKKMYPTQTEGLGGKKLMHISVLKSITVGPFKFRKVPAFIFSDDYNVTSYPQMGGLIGNDLLRRFNVILNYPDQAIHLKPNTHYNDAFDYSYTGLSIYQINSQIQVMDIIKGSPGDIAGFQSGDIIFAVGSHVSKDIQVFKNILQQARGHIKVVVLRNGSPVELDLRIKNILR